MSGSLETATSAARTRSTPRRMAGRSLRQLPARGFSILELMIALALLGTLLAVAWSLLDTYRRAEQRGWNTAYRMQVSRVSRTWLEDDVSHMLPDRALSQHPGSGAASGATLTAFRGTSRGFSGWLLPSVDPLPWLDQVTFGVPSRARSGAGQASSDWSRPRLDPTTLCRVEYRLVGAGTTTEGANRYRLERSLYVLSPWSGLENESEASPADEVLDSADLYRTDDAEAEAAVEGERLIARDAIRHLVNARFRYTDGTQWSGAWNSRFGAGLPAGIELTYDFPAGSNPYMLDQESGDPDTLDVDSLDSQPVDDEVAMAGSLGNGSGEMLVEPRDVRIVVSAPGRAVVRGSEVER